MILSRELSNALNDLITAEMWSANLYMSMSVHFTMLKDKELAEWMKKKSFGELEKAYKVVEYSLNNGGQVVIGVINAVPTGFGSKEEIVEHAVKHEQRQIELANKYLQQATDECDTVTQDFLRSFADSQVDDDSAKSIVEKLKQNGDQSLDTHSCGCGKG